MIKACDQTANGAGRYLNPDDINILRGYQIEVFAEGLNSPGSILFTDEGDMLIADAGYATGNPSVSRLVDDHFELIADGFNVPISGINYRNGEIYVSHKSVITVIRRDGTRINILTGLPSFGDYGNSRVAFTSHDKMYFGQGTATNSGVVGTDNIWVPNYPYLHDQPGSYILLKGQNFATNNIFLEAVRETIYTGAFSAYGEPNEPYEIRKGIIKASGSILRSNLDGTGLELVAWGLRSPAYVKFDSTERLFVSNNGFDVRGSRPIANAPDEFLYITSGLWYGWPDFAGGEPVTLERFRPEGRQQPQFLLVNHPNVPPRPFATFPPQSMIIGFDFNNNPNFGPRGETFIAEFGNVLLPRPNEDPSNQFLSSGYRISRIDMSTGGVTTFAINKSGFPAYITREGGFGRPSDLAFGPDGAMYVVDMGTNLTNNPYAFIPNTGVIWKITRV